MKNKSFHTEKSIMYSIVLVFSISHAVRAEKLLNKAGIRCKLVPVPRHLSSDCGVSVRINTKDKNKVAEEFNDNNYEYDRIHDL